jgi:hypothetical protein
VKRYLVLEDDMRFRSSGDAWYDELESVLLTAPADAELLYLGGILPCNKVIYGECVEPVNQHWGAIAANPYFTGGAAPAPVFHFCAYSYILTRSGARKLLAALEERGCFTSIDHFLNHPAFGLKRYVLRDLITTCYQENDPIYQRSEFDNFKRVDTFDSDIWNNVDCWEVAEQPAAAVRPGIASIIGDVLGLQPANIITQTLLGISVAGTGGSAASKTFSQREQLLAGDPSGGASTSATSKFTYVPNKDILNEALKGGSIPLYVRQTGDNDYWRWLKETLCLAELADWEAAQKLMKHLLANEALAEKYRTGILAKWMASST